MFGEKLVRELELKEPEIASYPEKPVIKSALSPSGVVTSRGRFAREKSLPLPGWFLTGPFLVLSADCAIIAGFLDELNSHH